MPIGSSLSVFNNSNPFFLPLLALALPAALILYARRKPGHLMRLRRRIPHGALRWLVALALLDGALLVAFELYFFAGSCAVSERYLRENERLARAVVDFFQTRSVPIWPDYATLLSVVRAQPILPWDQDSDWSIMNPGAASLKVYATEARDQLGLDSTFDEARGLLQFFEAGKRASYAPHVDVWLWTMREHRGREYVYSPEPVDYQWREVEDIFPLRHHSWQGINISVPNDMHEICRREYAFWPGSSYTVATVYRTDCFYNFFNMRWAY
jgi:hypothetical protein